MLYDVTPRPAVAAPWRGLFGISLVLALAGCPSGEPPTDGSDPLTQLENTAVVAGETVMDGLFSDAGALVSPGRLDFGESASESLFVLRHFGEGEADYQLEWDAAWISVNEPSGRIVGGWKTVTVRIDRASLPAGENDVVLTAHVGAAAPVDVHVLATGVGADAPDVAILEATSSLDFGPNLTRLDVLIRNKGQGVLQFELTADQAWVQLSATSGQSGDGAFVRVGVRANREGLAPGVYHGAIHVDGDNGQRVTAAVAMVVDPAVEVIPDTSADFPDDPPAPDPAPGPEPEPEPEPDPNPPPDPDPPPDPAPQPQPVLSEQVLDFGETSTVQALAISNAGAGEFSWTASVDQPWLSVSPSSGTVGSEAATLSVSIDRDGLPAGFSHGKLTVTVDGEGHEVVVFCEQPPPAPGPDPNSLVSSDQILAWMRELQPLQKPHYSWPVPVTLYAPEITEAVVEYVRLTHAITMGSGWDNIDRARRLVEICKQVNLTIPVIPARIGIAYSPWHYVFPANYPPTYVGPEHDQEIALFRSRIEVFRDKLAQANAEKGVNIAVGAFVFDSERFYRLEPGTAGADQWNAAMVAKYDAFYDVCRDVFPDADVEWFLRGSIQPCSDPSGWCMFGTFTLAEQGDTHSLSLYGLPLTELMRDKMHHTVEHAASVGQTRVNPWVALASGFRRQGFDVVWDMDWNYDTYYSWQLGAELNHSWYALFPERFAPWDRADQVVFYPEPFGRAPHWGKHFIAYVRGANRVNELP